MIRVQTIQEQWRFHESYCLMLTVRLVEWPEQAERRWCLSGTPIQNSIDDLYAYMRFLRYEPYARQSAFKTLIKEPLLVQPELGTQRLRAILKVMPFALILQHFGVDL